MELETKAPVNLKELIEHPLTSERRITRLQQSIMEKSLQSTSAV